MNEPTIAPPRPALLRRLPLLGAALASVTALAAIGVAAAAAGDGVKFTDVKVQTAQFIAYNDSIQLDARQEAVKKEALSALPAACCKDNNAYTCCCPCNMSLTVWGLSNYLIAEKGYDAEQVRAKVQEWLHFINPDGYSGDVCYTGGCSRPFARNGCGGMVKGRVTWDS